MILQLPKRGATPAEIEDAAMIAPGRAAVADGATDSALQADWARRLAARACASAPEAASFAEAWSGDAPRRWLDALCAAARAEWQAYAFALDLPWHGWNKVRQTGALATLLVCHWQQEESGALRYGALAVGDCLLLHVTAAGALLESFPITEAAAFDSSPVALSSLRPLPPESATTGPLLHVRQGVVAPGETLLLMSDALGAWALAQAEGHMGGVAELLAIETEAALAALVERERAARVRLSLRDDDITLVRIQATN